MIIGVTDEPPSLVDGWVRKVGAKYPIVSLKNGAFEDFLGVRFFPTAAVIEPGGVLTYSGSAGTVGSALDDALDDAEPLYPKGLSRVTEPMWEGDPAKAYTELMKLFEKDRLDDEERPVAEELRAYLEGLAATALADARKLVEAGKIYAAVGTVEEFAESKTAFPVGSEIESLLETLEADPNYKKEMKGGKAFAEAEDLEGEREFSDAFDEFRSVWKRYEGTRIAELAYERARAILDAGQPGWKSVCDDCRRSDGMRACEKHAEDKKL